MYWAALPSDEIVYELERKWDRYESWMRESGRLYRMQRQFGSYYGYDSHSSHEVWQSGAQGELNLLKINDFRNLLQHILVMTTQSRPAPEAKAINNDRRALSQALVANGLLDYYMTEEKFEVLFKRATELCLVVDEGFIVLSWDVTKGNPIAVDPTSQKAINEGDVRGECFHALAIGRDPYNPDPDLPWYIIKQRRNKWDMATQYPEHADVITQSRLKESDFRFTWWNVTQTEDTDLITVKEFRHKPTPALPQGRLVVYVDDQWLFDGPLPYEELHVYRIAANEFLDTPFGYSPAADLLGPQNVKDALDSTIISNQLTFGVNNIIAPKGSDVNQYQLTDGMKFLEVPPDYVDKIKPLELVRTAPEIFKYRDAVGHYMETISGVNSVARGNPEEGLKDGSGSALALVQSQAIQFNSGLQESYTQLLEDTLGGLITLLRKFANTTRVVQITGRSNQAYLKDFSFTGADLKNVSLVKVDNENPLSKTTSGKLQMANDMAQMSPEQQRNYMSIMSTGQTDGTAEDRIRRAMAVKAENDALEAGQPVTAIAGDNHQAHIEGHFGVIDSVEGRQDPQLLNNTLGHIQQHINLWRSTDPAVLLATGQNPPPPPLPPPPPPGMQAGGGPIPPHQMPPPPQHPPQPGGPAIVNATNPTIQRADSVSLPKPPVNPLTHQRASIPGVGNQ